MILMFCVIVCFQICFYIIGQNQKDFDHITKAEWNDPGKKINYLTLSGSMLHLIDLLFGNSYMTSFELGEGSQKYILYLLHILSAFTIQIHLLNMLIAIMGDIFSKRSEDYKKMYYRDRLGFVLDNFHLIRRAFGDDIKNVKYCVAALAITDDEDQDLIYDVHQ